MKNIKRKLHVGLCHCFRPTALIVNGEYRCQFHIGKPDPLWLVKGKFVEVDR